MTHAPGHTGASPAPDGLAQLDAEIGSAWGTGPGAFGGPTASTAGSAASPTAIDWRVFLGDVSKKTGRGPALHADAPVDDSGYAPWGGNGVVSTDQAVARWYSWSDSERKKWVDHLVKNGLLDEKDPDLYSKAQQAWSDSVQEAGNYLTLGKQKVTPWKVVDLFAGNAGARAGGPTTRTSTSSSVQSFEDLDARAAAEEAYSSLLGRSAKGKEAQALKSALNAYASEHPQISTTTQTDDGSGNVSSSSSSSGGITGAGAQQVAVDQARSDPSYAEYQASTTMFNWLQQALGATADA